MPPTIEDPIAFLVAEKDMSLRNALVAMLQDMGFKRIHTASNGLEAWTKLKNLGANFIIAGWNLMELSGLALLKIVRADPQLLATPFILVLEMVTKSQVAEAGSAGVTSILARPITNKSFTSKIRSVLELVKDPKRQEAHAKYQEGLDLMARQHWQEALEAFKQILGIFQSAEIYYNMGYISVMLEKYDEAIDFFRKATEINDTFAAAYQKMGECYLAMHDEDMAAFYLKQAAKRLEERSRHSGQSGVILEEISKVSVDTINVFNSLGIILRKQGRYAEALDQYKMALRVNPDDENIYFNIGRTHFEQNNYQRAAKYIHKALELKPSFEDAQALLKMCEVKLAPGH